MHRYDDPDLFKIENPEKHDPRYFAMLNNAVTVIDTSLEGGNTTEALAYYNYLLHLRIPHCPLGLNLSTTQYLALEQGLTNLIQIQKEIMKSIIDSSFSSNAFLSNLIETIDKQSKEFGVCYLPSGWIGNKDELGHFAGLKCRRLENGHYAISIINQGAGAQYHSRLHGANRAKCVYQSNEYEVDLQSESGHELLKNILIIKFKSIESDDKKINPYSEDDLYGLLKLIGKEIPLSKKNIKNKIVTYQRAGTCTITNLHGIARDILIDHHIDTKSFKRYHFVLKLRSLIAQYDDYKKGSSDFHVLDWATREFAVRINKAFHHILDETEIIYCGKLLAEIKQRLKLDYQARIREKCLKTPMPETHGMAPSYQIDILQSIPTSVKKNIPIITPSKSNRVETITPYNVAAYIKSVKKEEAYKRFNLLPHCSGQEKDPFWDLVSEEDSQMIIRTLQKVTSTLSSDRLLPHKKAQILAIALTAYDIAAQLAQRLNNTFKLGHNYAFALDDIYSDKNFFYDPNIYHIVKRIVRNFEQRCQGKDRVFSNAILKDENNPYDKTIPYVLSTLLDESQRRTIIQIIKKRSQDNKQFYTDYEIFHELMKTSGIYYIHNAKEPLNETILALIRLAATAHRMDGYGSLFSEENNCLLYKKNRYHYQVISQSKLTQDSSIAKHLPDLSPHTSYFDDYSENTIYHPRHHLMKLRNSFTINTYSSEFSKYVNKSEDKENRFYLPYQLFPSGSIHSYSQCWNTEYSGTTLPPDYEIVDKELRHIECSPNLQVVRVFSWARTHLSKLQYADVRTRINEIVFAYGQLDNVFANQFEIAILNMNKLLDDLLNYCTNEAIEDDNLIIWAARLAYDLRHHLEVSSALYNLPVDNHTMPSFKKALIERISAQIDSKIKSEFAHAIVADFRNVYPLDYQDYCLILVYRIIGNLGNASAHEESDEIWQQRKDEIIHAFKNDPIHLTPILNATLLDLLNFKPVKKWHLINNKLISEEIDFYIDLESGSYKKLGIEFKDSTVQLIQENKRLFSRLRLSTTDVTILLTSSQPKIWQSSDNKWHFIGTHDAYFNEIAEVYQTFNIEGREIKCKLLSKTEILDHIGLYNPFESEAQCDLHYQYWKSEDDPTIFIIRDENSEFTYFFSKITATIYQLSMNQKPIWERNGKILLNLVNGNLPDSSTATLIEKEWAARLSPIFGVENIRCIAKLSNNHQSCQLQRIEHLLLNLQFTVNDTHQLMCDNFPGYLLSEQMGLQAYNGFSSVIILENITGDQKIILPAFSLVTGEKNNAFNFNIIDHGELCNTSQPYYLLSYNRHHHLIGDSIEANLYLAILYRSLGNFKQAINYLKHCYGPNNISPEIVNIATLILKRKIKSPLGAAFDLKLECYLQEHKRKWVRDRRQNIKFPSEWNEWMDSQGRFYTLTYSHHKQDVSIIPAYLRLTDEELEQLNINPQIDVTNIAYLETSTMNFMRTKRASMLHYLLTVARDKISQSEWKKYTSIIANQMENITLENYDQAQITWRLSNMGQYENAALVYFIYHFKKLLADAISENPSRVLKLKIKLFSLLQNDTIVKNELYDLVPLLIFAYQFPELFKQLDLSESTIQLIITIADIVSQNKFRIQNGLHLINPPIMDKDDITLEQPLPTDYIAQHVLFSIAPITLENKCKHPLQIVLAGYFTRISTALAKEDFTLDISGLTKASPIEIRLLNQYKKGHLANQNKTKIIYHPKKNADLNSLKYELIQLGKESITAIEKFKHSLLQLANHVDISSETRISLSYNLLALRVSEQHHDIHLSDLFISLLEQNPTLLTQHNPFLNQADIELLYANLANFTLLNSRFDLINEILKDIHHLQSFSELKPYQLQLLGEKLDKKHMYEINQFPELLVYEYATKRILREDQVNIIIKIIQFIEFGSEENEKMQHCLLQFAAGGGKTSVLIPILAYRFARMGFLPVIFNSNELYQLGLDDIPANLRACFEQKMEVIERELDHEWSSEEFHQLLNDLERWRQQKKCVLLKPVTWHAINICHKLHQMGEHNSVAGAEQILNYLKKHAVKLEDEGHIISNPLQQSIKSYGKMLEIPKDQIEILLMVYDQLMGIAPQSNNITKLAGIKAKRKRKIIENELCQLQSLLVSHIIKSVDFGDITPKKLNLYILKSSKERPTWLKNLHNSNNPHDVELADRIVFVRAFIHTHLPHILSKQYKKDYGPSIHEGDFTVAPKHEQKDTTSHYGDPILIAALTIQLYHLQGLLPEHIDLLLNKLLKDHETERQWNKNTDIPTVAENILLDLIPLNYSFHSCRDLTPHLRQQLKSNANFYQHPTTINLFLTQFALPQIQIPEKRISSTPAEMQAGFNRSLILTATPGLPELYPAFLKPENCFLDEAFEAQVIDTLLKLQNRGLCTLKKSQTPADFFNQIPPELLEKMTTLIDRGALLTDFEAKDIIESYLGLETKHATHTAAFFSRHALQLKSKANNIKEVDIVGTGLVEALKKQGLKPEEFLLFLFIDLSKTTGTDIKRPHSDHAGLTVGKGQTVTETIQAAMRERQLLDDNAQSITWTMFQSLYIEIYPDTPIESFDPRKLFYWLIHNEAEQIKIKLIHRAYQGIEEAITSLALHINKASTHLYQPVAVSAWNNYELDTTEENATTVLHAYAKKLYGYYIHHKYRKEKSLKNIDETLQRIDKIITETASLITTLPTVIESSLNNEIQQEMQQTAQQEKELQVDEEKLMETQFNLNSKFVFSVERYSSSDSLITLFDQASILHLPINSNIKLPSLKFNPSHFIATQETHSNIPAQLKNIEIILIKISYNHSPEYLACTAAGGEYYSYLLQHSPLSEQNPAFALITINGDILCISNNLSIEECPKLITSDDCQQMLTYTHFLNGQINNSFILSQLIQKFKWSQEQYHHICNAIKAVHIALTPVSLEPTEALITLCDWRSQVSESKTSSLSHPRYQKPPILSASDHPHHLHAVMSLDKPIDDVKPPIPYPKRALEGYLFGEKIVPIPASETTLLTTYGKPLRQIHTPYHPATVTTLPQQEEIIIDESVSIIEEIMTNIIELKNSHEIPEKEIALSKIQQLALALFLDDSISSEIKALELEKMMTEFSDFDQILENFYLGTYKLFKTKQNTTSTLALKAISLTYKQWAYDPDYAFCKNYLLKWLISLPLPNEYNNYQQSTSSRANKYTSPSPEVQFSKLLKDLMQILQEPTISNSLGEFNKK